jgi:hypothetical protein
MSSIHCHAAQTRLGNVGRDSWNVGCDSWNVGRDSRNVGRDSGNIDRDSIVEDIHHHHLINACSFSNVVAVPFCHIYNKYGVLNERET